MQAEALAQDEVWRPRNFLGTTYGRLLFRKRANFIKICKTVFYKQRWWMAPLPYPTHKRFINEFVRILKVSNVLLGRGIFGFIETICTCFIVLHLEVDRIHVYLSILLSIYLPIYLFFYLYILLSIYPCGEELSMGGASNH